jgi:hypothetical protein
MGDRCSGTIALKVSHRLVLSHHLGCGWQAVTDETDFEQALVAGELPDIAPRLLVAGRALVGMSQEELSAKSGVAIAALRRYELKTVQTRRSTRAALFAAVRAAGVEFIPGTQGRGPGVRLSGSPIDQ